MRQLTELPKVLGQVAALQGFYDTRRQKSCSAAPGDVSVARSVGVGRHDEAIAHVHHFHQIRAGSAF